MIVKKNFILILFFLECASPLAFLLFDITRFIFKGEFLRLENLIKFFKLLPVPEMNIAASNFLLPIDLAIYFYFFDPVIPSNNIRLIPIRKNFTNFIKILDQ